MALFRAREIKEGANPDEIRRQINEALKLIERDLSQALSSPRLSEVITASTYALSFGEVARVAPPSTGQRLILPEPNLARLGARATVVQEAASGALSMEVINGTINGATTLSYLAGLGTVEFILTPTGWYGWSVSLVNDLPLTALADQIAESFLGNFTAGAAPPTARAGSSVAGGGLTYTAGGTLAVGTGTGITVNANDVAVTIPLTDADKGDITVSSSGTVWTIDAAVVTNAKRANMAAATISGRALGAGTGAPTDLTGAEVADIIETEGFTWTGNWALTSRIRWGVGAGIGDFTLTGNTDNLAIGAVNTVRILGNNFNLTGMVPDNAGHLVWLQNDDAADTLVLVHDATSTAANRFYLPNNANYTIPARGAVWARYDGAASRWHIGSGKA